MSRVDRNILTVNSGCGRFYKQEINIISILIFSAEDKSYRYIPAIFFTMPE